MRAVQVNLKGVHGPIRSRGRVYYYAWRGGPRLKGEPGSPEFIRSYEEACNPLAGLDKRRLSAWVTLYKASDEFAALAPSTQAEWGRWLERIKTHFGSLSIRQFDRPEIRADIIAWRSQWKATPRTADYGKQVLSRLLSFVTSRGALLHNICAEIPGIYSADRAGLIWLPDDVHALTAAAAPEIGWAARLAALSGLRKGDLLTLSWSHFGPLAIEMKTGKSRGRRKVLIPLYRELRELMDTIPKRATTILTSTKKRPWTAGGFASSWRAAVTLAGLEARGLHFHDLRGTAATNFYRAGFTVREIAETLGWSEDRVERLIDTYVKRDEILRDRIRRLENDSATNSVKQV